MDARTKQALAEGLVDALGFVSGALAGALLGRSLGFAPANTGNGGLIQVGGAFVAGGHRGDGKVVPLLFQQGQRSRTGDFDVVGVGVNRENSQGFRGGAGYGHEISTGVIVGGDGLG